MIRVLLVDDHVLVRTATRALLEATDGLAVVGEAGSGLEGIEGARRLNPDVVIMDISMPEMNGIRAAAAIRDESLPCKVLILSMYAGKDLVQEALNAGALGYVTKRSLTHELIDAIRTIAKGKTYISRSLRHYQAPPSEGGPGATGLGA